MRFTLLSLLALLLIQSAANALLEKWSLTDEEADQMKNYYTNCNGNCKQHTKINKNKEVKEQIRQALDIPRINFRISWVDARYRDEDIARYIAARGIPAGEERGRVSGNTTQILKVKLKKSKRNIAAEPVRHLKEYAYYDIGSICPPPGDCSNFESSR